MRLILKIVNKKYWSEIEPQVKILKERIKTETNESINQVMMEYELRKLEFGGSKRTL